MIIQAIKYGEVNTSRLPKEYQEVEWIQSSGTQHINSNYKPTSEKLRIVCEFEYTAAHDSASVFGSQSGQQWSIVAYGSPAFYVGNGGGGNLLPQTTSLNTKYVLDVTADNGKLTVNLNDTVQTATYNNGLLKTQNIGIFCNIINDVASQLCSMRLYRMLIYDNDILVREFYPCYRKSDSAIGLFDLVESVFYSNAGTGTFAKGADVNSNSNSAKDFAYSGVYNDNRDENGVGTVRFSTSGTLIVKETISATAYLQAGGGGGVYCTQIYGCASGGGGGNQTVSVELAVGTYEIIIGTGGAGKVATGHSGSGSNGGDTTAFGYTSTGGKGGVHSAGSGSGGAGGTPNGIAGIREINTAVAAGGSPNGGAAKSQSYANDGGDGYVELTFS